MILDDKLRKSRNLQGWRITGRQSTNRGTVDLAYQSIQILKQYHFYQEKGTMIRYLHIHKYPYNRVENHKNFHYVLMGNQSQSITN